MKKIVVLLIAIMFITPAILAADELELGVAITPLSFIKSDSASGMEDMYGTKSNFFQDNLLSMHAGYSMMWLLYASVDANLMPAWWVKDATEYTDMDGVFHQGIYAPGFITFVDVGIRPTFGNFIVMAELGINMMYVHSAYDTREGENKNEAGFNFRLGLGYKFKALSISLLGTTVFATFDKMISTLQDAAQGNQQALGDIKEGLIPSLAVYFHL